MENRHGLAVETRLAQATGTAEGEASLEMVKVKRKRKRGRITVGGDKDYDVAGHVAALRKLKVTPHLAQNTQRRGGSTRMFTSTAYWFRSGLGTPRTSRKPIATFAC